MLDRYMATIMPPLGYAVRVRVHTTPGDVDLAFVNYDGNTQAATSLAPGEIDALIHALQAARALYPEKSK